MKIGDKVKVLNHPEIKARRSRIGKVGTIILVNEKNESFNLRPAPAFNVEFEEKGVGGIPSIGIDFYEANPLTDWFIEDELELIDENRG